MDNDGKFWINWWIIIAVVLSIFIMSLVTHAISKNNKILKAIELGADPQAASCAINNVWESPVCAAYTAHQASAR